MFYKAISPGNIGHSIPFLQAAAPSAKAGFEGYFFDAGLDFHGEAARTKDLLAQHNLKAAGFFLPVEFRQDLATFEEGVLHLPARARFAREIGITGCVTWIMPFHDTLDFEENYALHKERLTLVCQMLGDEDIRLGLEFVGPKSLRMGKKHEFIHSLGGMLNLCDDIDANTCGLLLDAFHWQLAGQEFGDFNRLQPQDVVCVHINDAAANVPDHEQQDGVRRLPGTTGVLNLDEFFAGLELLGYDGPVVVEPFEPFLGQIPFEQAARVTLRSMNRVWPK